ncbi:S8 family serine peptidase [Candidatus Sumerlaeota bacterium]|nr:S8 family serine peptidase [Candidatus Sumerlaeota bacterium]
MKKIDRRFGLREAKPVFSLSGAVRGRTPGAAPKGSDIWVLKFDPKVDIEAAIEAYEADPNVVYAEPNYVGTFCFVPSDPLYAQTSSDLGLIGVETAWDVQAGADASVVVAVIDSGVEALHPDLSAVLDTANSFNFVEGTWNVFDDIGHGTRVAGIVGASANNGEGIAGIAFGCTILSLDVAEPDGSIATADVASAVAWAVAYGTDVINMSLRFTGASQTLENACRAAWESGALLVAAAGNENRGDRPVYPACYDCVMGVGAVMDDGATRAPWSNYNGIEDGIVDLVAPGATVFSTIPGAQYNGTYGSGTSFAASMVSGVAALLMAHNPGQSAEAIRSHLRSTAQTSAAFQPADGQGYGLVRADAALSTEMRPDFSIATVTIDDATSYSAANNADGLWQKGETIALAVTLENSGADATSVTATLSTTDTLVTLGDTAGAWGDVASGEEKAPTDAFTSAELSVSSPAHRIPFTLTISAGTSPTLQVSNFEVSAEAFHTPPAIIGSNTTWTSDTTYVIAERTFVMDPATLTIEPGTTVRFDRDGALEIRGAIDAQGTADDKITFTSLDGQSGGDWIPESLPIGEGLSRLALGDVNGDGKNDLVTVNAGADTVSARFWSNGGFEPPITMPVRDNPQRPFVGDADNDGYNDIVVANRNSHSISLLRWTGTGFAPRIDLSTLYSPGSVYVGDADNDGDNDVVYEAGIVQVIPWNGSDFGEAITVPDVRCMLSAVVVADADNDGDNEVVVANSYDYDYSVSISSWNGTGFDPPVYVGQDSAARQIVVADVDNDGDNDILMSRASLQGSTLAYRVQVLCWNGSGFDSPLVLSSPYSPIFCISVGDADNDGDNDWVVSYDSSAGSNDRIVVNLWGPSGWETPIPFTVGKNPTVARIGDASGDGENDLVVSNAGDGTVSRFRWSWDLGRFPKYEDFWIRTPATSAVFKHCDFQFAPVLDDSSVASFEDCLFDRTGGTASLSTTTGTLPIARCTARFNTGGYGIDAGSRTLSQCVAEGCGRTGLLADAFEGCVARNCSPGANVGGVTGHGMMGRTATDCVAEGNEERGVYVSHAVRGCLAVGNGDWGIYSTYGKVQDSTSTLNASGIRGGIVQDCFVSNNDSVGIEASDDVRRCVALENGDEGIVESGSGQIKDCTVAGNGAGLNITASALRCAVTQNEGPGIAGGDLDSCSVYHNTGTGLVSPLGVRNSWVVGNDGMGIQGKSGAPYSAVSSSTIVENAGSGIRNSGRVERCNIDSNGGASGYDYKDTRSSGEIIQVDLSGNYWGTETTALMDAHPWGTYYNIPRIWDFLDDTSLCEAKYDGHLAAPAASPDGAPPAFLLAVQPDTAEALNVGLSVFQLTFSKPMNTASSAAISVTFDTVAPYAAHVVEPAPGWLDSTTWQGVFAVQSDTGDGLNVLRVANARDAGGRFVPVDTAHTFTIDTEGALAANNGVAVGTGSGTMDLTWTELNKPPTALGYNVRRSPSGIAGTYRKINASVIVAPHLADTTGDEDTTYYYIVDIVDSQSNSTQWTPPFYGRTLEATAARMWQMYE